MVSPEERLRREQEQKKKEEKKGAAGASKDKGKGDKKRGKTNDSGTSSKDSSTRAKEKKKVRERCISSFLTFIQRWRFYEVLNHSKFSRYAYLMVNMNFIFRRLIFLMCIYVYIRIFIIVACHIYG